MSQTSKFFKIMLLTSSACFLGSIVSVCLKDKNALSNTKITDESIKKIDAKLIGANHGTIDVKFIGNECIIVAACSDFLAAKNFNFNGGKFIYEKVEYTITEIWHDAFSLKAKKSIDCYFQNCNLTIPSTIKKVGDFAFVYNYRRRTYSRENQIIGINFEEGVEEIGEHAFEGCEDIKSKKISFPNSIKYIGKNAFQRIEPLKELDLSALDHVIEIKHNPFDKKGCLWQTEVNAIRVIDEDMKEKYCSDKYWSSVAKYFVLKDEIVDTISSKYVGGDEKSTFDFRCLDPNQTKITGVSDEFVGSGNFNFNGGKFSYKGNKFTITEIWDHVFDVPLFCWYFKNCKLTIPSTIKKIGDRAFYGNSRNTFLSSKEITDLKFEEGIEDIGIEAFSLCNDLETNILSLPNSLQHIGNNAFEEISSLEELDLSTLDHVINIDADPFGWDGFLFNTKINKIWLKDETIKDKYCSDKHWSSAAKYFVLKDHIFKTINSKYIGGDSNSTFDFNYLDPKQTKITSISSKFVATGNFNFNGGKFTYDGTEYVISEIAYDAFHPSSTSWYFKECNLTIPSTIKKISDRAFYGNSRNTFLTSKEIISINFNEGLEDIGEQAFYKCDDLQSSQLVLPNSLQHIGNNAFAKISPLKELDLSTLDHVINIDTNPFSKDGCLYDTNIKTIWVKDQATKDKYCNDQYWSSASSKIKVKS